MYRFRIDPSITVEVPITDVEDYGSDGATIGERRQWHEKFSGLRTWVPSDIDDTLWEKVQSFMGWFDIVKHMNPHPIWFVNDARPCMTWLWFNTEHLPRISVFKVLKKGVEDFHEAVAWCSVYNPKLYIQYTKTVEKVVDVLVSELSMPIALRKIVRMHRAEMQAGTLSGPAATPDAQDRLEEFVSESDQDEWPKP